MTTGFTPGFLLSFLRQPATDAPPDLHTIQGLHLQDAQGTTPAALIHPDLTAQQSKRRRAHCTLPTAGITEDDRTMGNGGRQVPGLSRQRGLSRKSDSSQAVHAATQAIARSKQQRSVPGGRTASGSDVLLRRQ